MTQENKSKSCTKCGINKPASSEHFYKDKTGKYCFQAICKICRNAHMKAYDKTRLKNKKEHAKNYYLANREKILEQSNQYYEQHKEKVNKRDSSYRKLKRNTNINFKLACSLRSRLHCALKSNQKTGSAIGDLGCSIEQLKKYIEAQFQPGMSWDNHSPKGWHLDHVKPLASFNLTDPEQFKTACHYTNLQPLWAKENLKKGDNYETRR